MSGQNALKKYTVAGIADVLGCFGVPTGTAMQIYQDILDKRAQDAMEILLSEIRQGDFSGVDQNDAVSIIARFQRDAMEGVALNNLRLLARMINGMAKKKELKAPSFLKYANILASLTEDEITVLAVMTNLNWATFMPQTAAAEFKKNGIENYQIIQQALLRTGLVSMQVHNNLVGDIKHVVELKNKKIDSGFLFTLTPLFTEIEQYIKFFNVTKEAA